MKKLLIILFTLLIGLEASSQIYTYRTYQFAFKQTNSSGQWKQWSDWQDSNMRVVINFNNDYITIYSPTTQTYKVTEYLRKFTDNSGGNQVEFSAIDQDGDRCHIRLRIEKNGNSQIYVEYSNLILCYNVRRTN